MQNTIAASGLLKVRKIGVKKAPLSWRIRNATRVSFLWGWFTVLLAKMFSRLTGIPTIHSELRLKVRRHGEWIDYGVVSRRVVTNAGVAFLVDAWQNLVELENMKYHGVGTGTTAEAAGDTALVTESTTILNPDSTRATGTQTEPAANQLTSTATVTFDGNGAITEHGVFSQAATGGGTLWDRSVFSAVNVSTGESILCAYTATFTAGG